MAKLFNVNLRTYQFWEAGTYLPSAKYLVQVQDILKLKNLEL